VPTISAVRQAAPIVAIPPVPPELVLRSFTVFGTFGSLLITRPAALDAAYRILRVQLGAIDRSCSRFRPDSELSAANMASGSEIAVSPVFGRALATALRAAEVTDGDVDPTCGGSLVRLGYDRDLAEVRAAARPMRRQAIPAGGWQNVRLDTSRGTLRVPAGVLLDLGATAKALAADLAAAAIAEATGAGVLVNLGGDIAVAGPPPAAGWKVEIDAGPPDADGPGHGPVVAIHDGGLATSSPLARTWTAGKRPMHHIVAPATGQPAPSCWIAASVAAASCVDANTASTAAIIRSEQAPQWLSGFGLPARLVRPDGSVITTGGWPS
jgi:thiamine biosynthesis lipoprotein